MWTPFVGEELTCLKVRANIYDANAVGVFKREGSNLMLVGRVPRELAGEFVEHLRGGRRISCTISGRRENQRGRGLEVPCVYHVQ